MDNTQLSQGVQVGYSTKPNNTPPPEFFLILIPFIALVFFLNWKFFKRWNRFGDALTRIADSLEKIEKKLGEK